MKIQHFRGEGMKAGENERLRLFVPCKNRPRRVNVDHEWVENPNDGSFAQAFSFGTLGEPARAKIDAAMGALVVYSPFDLNEGRMKVLDLVRNLRKQGAIAVRVEQSKLGWEIDKWIELISSKNFRDLHRAVVVMLTSEEQVRSCGMHAFSLPDSMVGVQGDVPEMQDLLTTLNVYQIEEDPVLLTGHTFSPEQGAPRRLVERWPDDSYSHKEVSHNPFGVWRVGPPGGQGRPVSELTLVFVPALVTILSALEQSSATPLAREQVDKARDEGTCIAMNHRDALKLEKSRGYSDIEPALAWEQWQVIRTSS